MLTLYFIALFLTIVIEITVAYILKWRDNKTWLAIILVNFITHPTLWYLLWILSRVFNPTSTKFLQKWPYIAYN